MTEIMPVPRKIVNYCFTSRGLLEELVCGEVQKNITQSSGLIVYTVNPELYILYKLSGDADTFYGFVSAVIKRLDFLF